MIEQLFSLNKIIPVVIINDVDKVLKLSETLLEAGINTMEVTLRTENALEVLRKVSQDIPEMILGAGTILNAEHFADARDAGVKYIISPGLTSELIGVAQNNLSKVKYLPGVCTPSQAMDAANAGFSCVKFFPAEAYNAYAVIKALASPLPHIKFCPTGGISLDNMQRYLELPNVFAVGLSSIVESSLIEKGDFSEIRRRCEEACVIMNKCV